ncbi:hypothetical protein AB9M75_11825 [Lactobacillus sp. AN1001]
MKKEKGISLHIYGIEKNEAEKLHSMAKKKAFNSLNAYLQFLVRREIENDLIGSEKYSYKNYFESMRNMLLNLSEGYIRAAKRKGEIEKLIKRIQELTDNWLFMIDPELKEFGEQTELVFDEETGIIYERKVHKNLEQEENKKASIDESPDKIITANNTPTTKNISDISSNKDSAEIKIRGLTKDDVASLKLIAKQAKAPNLNQFMIDQMYLILQNGGLSSYDNRLADDILEVKDMLSKIADAQTRQELRDMKIIAKLNTNIEAVIRWIEFMSVADTQQF